MSSAQFVDSHCHIDFPDFDQDRDAVIASAQRNGVYKIIVPSVSQADWSRTISTCLEHDCCDYALGMHPLFIDQHQPQHLSELADMLMRNQPVAVGEIGLDFYNDQDSREKQIHYFNKQLIIAKRADLAVIIHNRKAHDECLAILNETEVQKGIIHAFNGSIQQAEKYIDLGFLLGFGGMLTYQRSRKLRKLAELIPLQSIVLETDAPDMAVMQHRGERNSPEYIPLIARALAAIKSVTVAEVAAQTTANFNQLFASLQDG